MFTDELEYLDSLEACVFKSEYSPILEDDYNEPLISLKYAIPIAECGIEAAPDSLGAQLNRERRTTAWLTEQLEAKTSECEDLSSQSQKLVRRCSAVERDLDRLSRKTEQALAVADKANGYWLEMYGCRPGEKQELQMQIATLEIAVQRAQKLAAYWKAIAERTR